MVPMAPTTRSTAGPRAWLGNWRSRARPGPLIHRGQTSGERKNCSGDQGREQIGRPAWSQGVELRAFAQLNFLSARHWERNNVGRSSCSPRCSPTEAGHARPGPKRAAR